MADMFSRKQKTTIQRSTLNLDAVSFSGSFIFHKLILTFCIFLRPGHETKPKHIVLLQQQRRSKRAGSGESGSGKFKVFAILCGRDVANACFYSTINLRRLGSVNRRRHWKVYSSRMKKEDCTRGIGISSEEATREPVNTHVGNKVLPITESNAKATSSSSGDEPGKKDKEKAKGDRVKAVSRMKELLRWAAAMKTEKGAKFISRKVRF